MGEIDLRKLQQDGQHIGRSPKDMIKARTFAPNRK
jgi:hypothetical protein